MNLKYVTVPLTTSAKPIFEKMVIDLDAESLAAHYQKIRSHSEQLCEPLTMEDYIPQPVVFASPPKWHLAHLTWFFEAFLLETHLEGYKVFDPQFSYLFNSYYNGAGERIARDKRGAITRPSVKQVYAYRNYVDQIMTDWIKRGISREMKALIILGLNHEQQHQELLLTDLKHTLFFNPLRPVYREDHNLVHSYNQSDDYINMSEGIYEIGFEGKGFAYDNESGRHKVYLHDFEIARALVTNGEYLEFIKAGGYEKFDYWLDEGWAWVNQQQITAPLYWKKQADGWYHFTLNGLVKIDMEAQLSHVSFFEAAAFAEWKGMRLPTEFEWEAAADQLAWGSRWEWTNSAYLPYPGFETAPGALGEYNGKFMVNQMVLRGASVATSPGHSRKTYRNFFPTDTRWQYSGIRLVKK